MKEKLGTLHILVHEPRNKLTRLVCLKQLQKWNRQVQKLTHIEKSMTRSRYRSKVPQVPKKEELGTSHFIVIKSRSTLIWLVCFKLFYEKEQTRTKIDSY